MLLGIRTAPKEELGCSSAEVVYGTPLTAPGDFLPGMADTHDDTSLCLRQLRDQVRSLVYSHPYLLPQYHALLCPSNPAAGQVRFYLSRHSPQTPQRPYEGPFKVIQPGLKTFQVDVEGRSETISVDRLRPAEIDLEHPTQVAVPRRRGRPRKLPPQHISVLGGGGGGVAGGYHEP